MPESVPGLVGGGFVVETAQGSCDGPRLIARARELAAGLRGYPAGAGVLIDVRDPVTALAVALGAWWVCLRVAFSRADSPFTPDEQAAAVDAAVRICDGGAPGTVSQRTVADLAGPPVGPVAACGPDDPALDILTSGTTGAPKCVEFSHHALAANARALAGAMAVSRDDRIWTSLPHGLPGVLSTVFLPAAIGGCHAVLRPPGHPAAAASALAVDAPSVVYAVPAVYETLVRRPRQAAAAPGVRLWLSSSCQLTTAQFERMHERWGAVVRSFYCGSEIGTVTFNDAADVTTARDSVGRPLPGATVQIEPSGPGNGRCGRVVVAGDMVGSGYRRRGTVDPFPASGVRTSDLGTVDEQGFLYLVGRDEDRIHVGADVVDPHLLEMFINTQTGVADCMAVARAHPRLGSVVEMLVVREDRARVSARDIILACRARGFRAGWVPRAVTWIDTLPRTPAGKPDRNAAQRAGDAVSR